VKSLGAKTNHLPNIQGQSLKAALQAGVWNKNFGRKSAKVGPSNDEATIITCRCRKTAFHAGISVI
jgi:hypothetical protein